MMKVIKQLAQDMREYSDDIIEPAHDKTYKMACAPSEDSDQPGRPPSLIRVFAVRMKKAWVLSYPLGAQRRLLSYLRFCFNCVQNLGQVCKAM